MRAVNLIPAEQREGAGGIAGSSGGASLIVLGLIVGVAVLALLYGSAQRKTASERSELAKVESELSTARKQVGRLAPYTSFISMADQRAKEISQLVASRFDWSHALNELGRVLPRTAALTSLAGEVGGGTSGGSGSSSGGGSSAKSTTSSTPPGSMTTFQLSGCATSQSEVANTLQRLRLMDGATEVTLGSSAGSAGSAGSSGGAQGTGGGACPMGSPTFSATVTFAPLPAPPVAPPASAILPVPVSSESGHAASRRVDVSAKSGGSR